MGVGVAVGMGPDGAGRHITGRHIYVARSHRRVLDDPKLGRGHAGLDDPVGHVRASLVS